MSKQEYSDLLKKIEWQEVRKHILNRDFFECRVCGNSRIMESSLGGVIVGVKRKKFLTYVLNSSDPRFNPEYEVEFKDKDNVIVKQLIYAHPNYEDKELQCFVGGIIHYNKRNRLSFLDSSFDQPYITCIKDLTKTNNKWFYIKQLDVHHTYYDKSLLPWEYPKDSLKTLCWICHEDEHTE